jgi:hypothetical protein
MLEHLAGPAGMIDVRGVPSGTYEANKPDRTARYRIFEISNGRIIGQAMRVWHRSRKVFEHDSTQLVATA